MDATTQEQIERVQTICADQIRSVMATVLELALGRAPTFDEAEHGRWQVQSGSDAHRYLTDLLTTETATKNIVQRSTGQTLFVPPGHYYSPIVDTSTVSLTGHDELQGLKVDTARQLANLKELAPYFNKPTFPKDEQTGIRFYYDNDFFGSGDAVVLSAIINKYRPARIVEVGSGFSSAVILDTLDANPSLQTTCTFIEPFPHRLEQLLRATDYEKVRIIQSGVQSIDFDVFDCLEENDIVFFDTTHICKTGSDVNYELFYILPRLKSGVLVHFHDVFDRFEYPSNWILGENRSWNENYLLRAFLMYNNEFEIYLITDAIWRAHGRDMAGLDPAFAHNPGGALWLRRR